MAPNSSASFIGGDLVVVPKGSERVADAVNFMKFLLSDEVQVEVYAKALNLTTRTDMVENKYFEAEPLVQDVAKALDVGRTPYTLTFFEQINSPQGPWLQMLQRAYYTDDNLDTVIADAKKAMKDIASQDSPVELDAGPALAGGAPDPRHGPGRTACTAASEPAGRARLPGARRCSSCSPSPSTRWARWSGCRCTTGR